MSISRTLMVLGLTVAIACGGSSPDAEEGGPSSVQEAACERAQDRAAESWRAYAAVSMAEAQRAQAAEALRRAAAAAAAAREAASAADVAARSVSNPAMAVHEAARIARQAAEMARRAAEMANETAVQALDQADIADTAARDAIDRAFEVLPPSAAVAATRTGAEDAVALRRAASNVAEASKQGADAANSAASAADDAAQAADEAADRVRDAIRDVAVADAAAAAGFRAADLARDPVTRAGSVHPDSQRRSRAAAEAARAAHDGPSKARETAMSVPNDPASPLFSSARQASVISYEICSGGSEE